MCGVIVVDAGRSRSTCLGRDAYIHDHCLGYGHNYLLFYQLPNSNLFTHHMLSLFRREASSENYGPRVYLYSYIKTKNILLHLFFLYFILYFCSISLSITIQFNLANNRRGIGNPLFASGARICYLVCRYCVEVLCGSPTGLITLVLNWGKYLSLLYRIILSSSRKSPRSSQVAGRISGAAAGETSSKPIKYLDANYHLLCLPFICLCLSFSSPPLLIKI